MKKKYSENEKSSKKKTKQDKTLLVTFFGLIILVASLGVVALNLDNIHKDDNQDLVIPILEINSVSELSVQVNDLEKDNIKEYILAVTNYKDKEVLDKILTYDVDITPSENTTVKVYKNYSSDNLLTEDDLLIENNKLKANKKMKDTYKIVIKAKEKTKQQEKITIKINS